MSDDLDLQQTPSCRPPLWVLPLAIVLLLVAIVITYLEKSPLLGNFHVSDWIWATLTPGWILLIWRFPQIGSGLFLSMLTIVPSEVEWALVAPAATIALRHYWHARNLGSPLRSAPKIAVVLLLLWLIWGLAAAILSPEPGYSTWTAFRIAALALGGLAAGMSIAPTMQRNAVLAAASGLCIVAIQCFLLFHKNGKASSPPFFPDTNLLSAAMALLLPLLAACIFAWKGNWRSWIAIPLVLTMLVAIVLFRSRGAWMSLIAMVLASPIVFLRPPRLRLVWTVAIVLVAGSYFAIRAMQPATTPTAADHMSQLRSIGEIGQDFSNRERLMRWECALRMANDKPIFGHGPGRYPQAFRLYIRGWKEGDRISYWFGWRLGAHNDTLTTLAETGWVGAMAFGGMLLTVLGIGLGRQRQPKAAFSLQDAMAISLLGWAIHSCFNDLLSNACLAVWAFWLMGGIVARGRGSKF